MRKAIAGYGRSRKQQTLSAALLFLLLLGACQTIPQPEDTAVITAPVAAGVEIPADAPRFLVDQDASEIRLLVYRAGPLARVGHNHVVSGHVRGEIRAGERSADSGFRLEIPVESFTVDARAARAEEGEEFASEVSDEARQATRENMLGKDMLDAASRPFIEIASIALAGPRWNPTVTARASLRGATRDLRFPAAVAQQGDLLTVIASFRIRQSDFELTPFSTLGGGLQVRDAIDIRLRIIARRVK
ncbi:MAG: YceI family protein [Betaproteobacteria bacterium]|nr:YceI family protein [Betaproteobacteria bacterium]